MRGATIDGNAVLELTDESDSVLAYFRGDGDAPRMTTCSVPIR